MALMVGALYDALRSANVDEDRARKASEEVADFQKQATDLRSDFQKQIGDVLTQIAVLKWMMGFVLAGIVGMIFLQLRMAL